MSTSTRTTWLSALAVLLTSVSLLRVYEDAGWLLPVVGAVVAAALGGLLARRLHAPALLQPVFGVLGVGLFAAVLSASQTFAVGLVPTLSTVALLGERVGEGLLDVDQMAPPVPSTPGLVLLALLGAGLVAVVADLLAVGLRRPALAGLPLLTLLVVPSATIEGGVGVLPFACGAAGWLALLMADSGERVGHWGTALRSAGPSRGATRSDDTSLGRVGRRIGVAALGTALVVPALVPGLESSLVDGGGGSGFGGGGSRTTITYNPLTELGGQLRLPEPRAVLRYTTSDPTPDYLRLTTLDRFDDDAGWSSSELSADVRQDAVSRGVPAPLGAGSADVQPLTARILVQDLGGPWLPVPPVPAEIEVDGPWLWDAETQTVFSTRTDLEELDGAYRVESERVVPTVDRLARGGGVPESIRELAEAPEVSDFVRSETARITRDAPTPYGKATALQAYFRDGANGFEYSEDTSVPGVDAPNALERFMRGKQGFCEQYASAMAAMARVAGLPARVAVGFTPGTRDGEVFQVTTSDAHAWPEIWFAGHGWVRFEPTPRTDQVITPVYTVPPAPGSGPGSADPAAPSAAPAAPVEPGDPGASGDNVRQLDDPLAGEQPGTLADDGGLSRSTVLALAGLGLLFAVPAAAGALRRRRRWTDPGPEAAWAQVVEDGVDVGHRWRTADSPRAAAAHLVVARGLSGGTAQALLRVAGAVERARYARPGTVPAPEAAQLRDDASAVRHGLRATASWRWRWTARLAPPSTLQAMEHASGTAVADLLDRLDELVSAAGGRGRRLLRRRPRSA